MDKRTERCKARNCQAIRNSKEICAEIGDHRAFSGSRRKMGIMVIDYLLVPFNLQSYRRQILNLYPCKRPESAEDFH